MELIILDRASDVTVSATCSPFLTHVLFALRNPLSSLVVSDQYKTGTRGSSRNEDR